ncbi:MAG: ABC transporter substrate-binding protein [Hyphomicrobiaceae bacterium]
MAIVLQESLRAVFYAPFYAALALDAFREEGIEVSFVSAASPDVAARGLNDGTVHVTWGGPMRVNQTYAREPDCDIRCFCEVVTRDPFFLVGRTPNPGYRPQDLLGLRVATVSEVPTPWMCLQHDLRLAGVDPTNLTRVADRSMADNAAALRRGDADVIQIFEPFVEDLVESGAGHIWYAAATRGATSYTTFYARAPFLAAHGDDCARLVRAIYRTQKWFNATPAAMIAGIIAPYFPAVPVPRLTRAIERYKGLGIWGRNPRLPRVGYDRLRDSLVSGGFVPTGTPFEVAVDNTLAERVMAEDPPPLAR